MERSTQPLLIVFDVNETLLDMSEVKKKVNKTLGSKRAFKLWFGMLLQYAMVDTVTGTYHDFSAIARATLQMTAKGLETKVSDEEAEEILETMKKLPPHEDVKEGLSLLQTAGFRLAALTNSPDATLQQQLQDSGLQQYFTDALSVDEFRIYKPHLEVYRRALVMLNVPPGEALMVAAHGWDIAGAMAAGMTAAFIERKGQSLYPLAPEPQYKAKNLIDLANQIIQQKDQL